MIFPDQAFHAQEIIVKVYRKDLMYFILKETRFRFFGYLFDLHFYGQN